MSHDKIKALAAEGFVEDRSIDVRDGGHACEACVEVNAKKESYPSLHDLSATHVNHTFHADLLHVPVATVDGKQYLWMVLDEFTRYIFVALLAQLVTCCVL